MTSPLPSRRSLHAAKSQVEEKVADGSESPVTTAIPAMGARSRTTLVSLPWWVLYWQPLVIAAVVAVFGFVVFYFAGNYAKSETLPVLVAEGVLDEAVVSGAHGAPVVLDLEEPVEVKGVQIRQDLFGSGRTVENGTPVLFSVSAFDGETGENLEPDGEPSLVVGVVGSDEFGDTLNNVLLGSTEGSRFVVGRELDTGRVEVDVVDVLYSIARGEEINAEGPLSVTLTDAGPHASHEAGDEPTEVITQVLIEGGGRQVQEGDSVVAQYVASVWDDGTLTASTWIEGSPKLIDLSTAMPGLKEVLLDRRVGTRIAAVIPAEKATGESALCVVVDILAATGSHATDLQ